MIGLAALAVIFGAGVERFKIRKKARYYTQKVEAAGLALSAQEIVKEGRLERGLPIDSVNDPNTTGLIGPQYTLITTDRASLQMKLTATNPNFAAAVLELLKKAGVKKGDRIGVALTGASPGLNIAVLAAIEILEVQPVIITSLGASSWGATDPTYTWLDIESRLVRKGLTHHRSVAASIGGGADLGRGLSPRGREMIREAIERNGQQLIEGASLEENISLRMAVYDSLLGDRRPKAFLNVGGGLASLGNSQNARLIPTGVTKRLGQRTFPRKGATILMAERGVPILHLFEVDRLAERFDLPLAPTPLPRVGEGNIFSEPRYSVSLASILLVLYSMATFCLIRLDMKHYLFRPPRKETKE